MLVNEDIEPIHFETTLLPNYLVAAAKEGSDDVRLDGLLELPPFAAQLANNLFLG